MLAPRIAVKGIWWRVTRSGSGPFVWTDEPADGRWQRVDKVRALYLADTEDTAWAEWYRHTSELGVPPARRMPRNTWRISVDVADIADLTDLGVLAGHGVTALHPTTAQWPITQPVGEAYFEDSWRGLLAPSAAHQGGRVLAIFRPDRAVPGLIELPPPNRYTELPPIPTGLRT